MYYYIELVWGVSSLIIHSSPSAWLDPASASLVLQLLGEKASLLSLAAVEWRRSACGISVGEVRAVIGAIVSRAV